MAHGNKQRIRKQQIAHHRGWTRRDSPSVVVGVHHVSLLVFDGPAALTDSAPWLAGTGGRVQRLEEAGLRVT